MEAKKRSSTVAGLQRAARITFARYPLSYRSRLLSLRTEIAAGLSRYTNRLEIESGLSVPLSGSSTRDDHRKLIAEANRRFQAGSYDTSIDALSQASACASVASKRLGLDWLGLSLCDSEIVGYIGHTALGLSVRAKAGVLGLTAPKRKVVVASRVANPSYLEYWRKYFEIHVVSGQQERAVCGRLWPLVEDILYFNGVNAD